MWRSTGAVTRDKRANTRAHSVRIASGAPLADRLAKAFSGPRKGNAAAAGHHAKQDRGGSTVLSRHGLLRSSLRVVAAAGALTLGLSMFPTQGWAQTTGTATATNTVASHSHSEHRPYAPGGGALWSGGSVRINADNSNANASIYRGIGATLQAPRPICDSGTARVTVTMRVVNRGPGTGRGYSGALRLFPTGFGGSELTGGGGPATNAPVGTFYTLNVSGTVNATDLAAGRVTTGLWLETYQTRSSKAWDVDRFRATFAYDTAGCQADLSVTKNDGTTTYFPGAQSTYTITVSNVGTRDVPGARISDPLPAGITTANWTCGGATNGATCGTTSGSGALNTTADLPANSSLTYMMTLNVPAGFTGPLTNSATVAMPDNSITNSTPLNNSATDTNQQGAASLSLDKTSTLNDGDGNNQIDAGETISYSFLVTNTGTVAINDATVELAAGRCQHCHLTRHAETGTGGKRHLHGNLRADAGPDRPRRRHQHCNGRRTQPGRRQGGEPARRHDPTSWPGTGNRTGQDRDAGRSPNGNGRVDAGETINYRFLVLNTGTVTLTDVTVDDPMLDAAGVTISPGPQTLAPNASVTFTASYSPPQAEHRRRCSGRRGTAIGNDPGPNSVESEPDTATVPPPLAALETRKDRPVQRRRR